MQLHMYPNYIMKLMRELPWLWQLHQTIVRWTLSMHDQQSSDYVNCKWNVTDAEASGTFALNDNTETSDLPNTPTDINNLRVIRVSPSTSAGEVYGSRILAVQFLVPNNTQD